jgi:signal transduction histidine kinase
MAFSTNETFQKLTRLLVAPTVDPSQRAARIQAVETDIILPLRVLVITILGYFFFLSDWRDPAGSPRDIGHHWFGYYFWPYVAANLAAGAAFIWVRQMSLITTQWINFSIGVLDVVLMSGLICLTQGFDSALFWVYLVLVLHNALAIPLALPQILLNLLALCGFVAGGLLDQKFIVQDPRLIALHDTTSEFRQETSVFNEHITVLIIWAAYCYGIQVLFERQRRTEAEATELAVRQERLHTAGRLAAEIAHKIKNPLGIITNASFCLQRVAEEGAMADEDIMGTIQEQSGIIREEVVKADEIITELMGYAQLAEGRVERLELAAEIDDAIMQVFPPGAKYDIRVLRYYSPDLPTVLMQRPHLASVLVNLLQNAREAMDGRGQIEINTRCGQQDSIIITIADNGPGIPADKIDKIFDAYFTTRVKGTGLGLAIVKHNAEMYGGTVRAESELGKGSRFVIEFPARTLMRFNT